MLRAIHVGPGEGGGSEWEMHVIFGNQLKARLVVSDLLCDVGSMADGGLVAQGER